MKIYTRRGDAGNTELRGGIGISKASQEIEVLGALDETNAALGLSRALGLPDSVDALIARVQKDLFRAGTEMASPERPARRHTTGESAAAARLTAERIRELEGAIDYHAGQLPPLEAFILPGGAPAAAALQLARCVCRRAERSWVAAHDGPSEGSNVLAYLNRLSDLLFVLARYTNAVQEISEERLATGWAGRDG